MQVYVERLMSDIEYSVIINNAICIENVKIDSGNKYDEAYEECAIFFNGTKTTTMKVYKKK
jgi:hypothetical protein